MSGMTLDRRTFIGTMGAALLAMRRTEAASIHKLGAQLYTVRTDMEKDFDGTLAKVAAAGYSEVEFAGYFNHTPQGVREMLKKHHLTAPSSHIDYGSLTGDKWARVIESAHTIGHAYLVNAWVDESIRKEPDAWKRIAETYNNAAATSQSRRHPVRVSQSQLRVRAGQGLGQAAVRLPARELRSEAREDGAGPLLDLRGRQGSARLLPPLSRTLPDGPRQGPAEDAAGDRRGSGDRSRSCPTSPRWGTTT